VSLTRSQMDAELQKLYDQIPAIPDCDGRCWTSCGPIGMSDRERQRIRQAGVRITPYEKAMASPERFWCDALTSEKRCLVYSVRPLICRIWGAVEGMPCVYGCVPEGGWLSDAEGFRLVAESLRIGGGGGDPRDHRAGAHAPGTGGDPGARHGRRPQPGAGEHPGRVPQALTLAGPGSLPCSTCAHP
jgi:hypothetical protein